MTRHETPRAALPALWVEGRRGLLVGLALTGCGQAAVAAATAWVLSRGLVSPSAAVRVELVSGMVGLALVLAVLRWRERVLAERLGQEYVHQVRRLLISRALSIGQPPSLGVFLVRSSNDLTALRNWIALGVAPLAVAVPLLLGTTVVLAQLHPLLAAAVVLPLLLLAASFAALGDRAFRRARAVRRERGRLAGHLSDTLLAWPAVRAGGGGTRELRRLTRLSTAVVDSAVTRAGTAGWIRAAATAAGGLVVAAVVATCVVADLGTATLVAAVTVVGLVSAPVQELGRVVEYRQAFRAARHVLSRALAPELASNTAANPRAPEPRTGSTSSMCGLVVTDLRVDSDVETALTLHAAPGARVRVTGSSRGRVERVLATLACLRVPYSGSVQLNGEVLSRLGDKERRAVLGYAAQAMRVERGSLLRAARYRRPDSSSDQVEAALRQVGLAETVDRLPHGPATELRRGGEPLDAQQRALLLLARAILGAPALLVLDHVDADVDAQSRQRLRTALRDFPGTVVAAGYDTDYLDPTQRWHVG